MSSSERYFDGDYTKPGVEEMLKRLLEPLLRSPYLDEEHKYILRSQIDYLTRYDTLTRDQYNRIVNSYNNFFVVINERKAERMNEEYADRISLGGNPEVKKKNFGSLEGKEVPFGAGAGETGSDTEPETALQRFRRERQKRQKKE